jgi:hypothetical protein
MTNKQKLIISIIKLFEIKGVFPALQSEELKDIKRFASKKMKKNEIEETLNQLFSIF